MANEPDSWMQWSQHVLKELERLNTCMVHLDDEMRKISNEIVALRVKSGMWGIAGGALPAIVALIYFLMAK